jgi:histidyl-tRNA synthetase
METNPLRVFDCKVERCREIMTAAPAIPAFLCPDCRGHFEQVQGLLSRLAVQVRLDPYLVRGLDYYCRTTFEVSAGLLGAQDAVAGGGRYDGLIRQMGGPDLPAIGFAIGLERAALLLSSREEWLARPLVCLIPLGQPAREKAFDLLSVLLKNEVPAFMEYEDKSLKSQLKRADKHKSRYAAILGSEELNRGSILIRNLATQVQEEIPLDRFVDYLVRK